MGRITTQEDVYNSIKFFVFKEWPDEKLGKLKVFVKELFDHNLDAVEPFDEMATANIRVIYYIGNWPDVIVKYKNQGIDIFNNEFDPIDACNKIYSFVANEKNNERTITRV